MNDATERRDEGLLPCPHEKVLGFVSDASVAIHDEPMVVWQDSDGEWWGGLPQSYIKLSDHNWTVDRWEPLQSRATPAVEHATMCHACGETLFAGDRGCDLAECPHKAATPLKPAPDALRDALEPFIKAARIIEQRPQDYSDRIVMIGGLADASDLRKQHFAALLGALSPAPVPSADGARYKRRIWMRQLQDTTTWIECNKSDLGSVEFHEVLDYALSPLPAVAAEAVAWQYRVKHDLGSPRQDEWCDWHETPKQYYETLCADVERWNGRLEVRALYASPPVRREREALESLANWCSTERAKLGAIDGYDYRSGEEYGLRCAEIEIGKRILSLQSGAGEGETK